MPARTAGPPRERERERDYDFSNVGKVGRRTGVTLAPRTVDEHGLENMTGLFSSPEKASAASAAASSDRRAVMESIEAEEAAASTPRSVPARPSQTPITSHESISRSNRGSTSISANPIPRSASPRKSGITGSARRIGRRDTSMLESHTELDPDNVPAATTQEDYATTPKPPQPLRPLSTRPATARRFDPDATPLRNMVLGKASSTAGRSARLSKLRALDTEIALNGSHDSLSDHDDNHNNPQPTETERLPDQNTSPSPTSSPSIPPVIEDGIVIDEDVMDVLGSDDQPVQTSRHPAVAVGATDSDEGELEHFDAPQDDKSDSESDIEHADPQARIAQHSFDHTSRDSETPDAEENRGLEDHELPPIPPEQDDEDDQDFSPAQQKKRRKGALFRSSSRRKRKSESIEDPAAVATSSPAAKRAKRRSHQGLDTSESAPQPLPRSVRPAASATQKQLRKKQAQSEPHQDQSDSDEPRPALKAKPVNTHMSDRQKKELDGVVDRIRARPNQNKSLFVLRRETPADENVAHTRSGRISIKPLAWWRNEGIVYGNSPSHVAQGQRFPMNSIKEIIRTEESVPPRPSKAPSRAKNQIKRSKSSQPDPGDEDDTDIEPDDTTNIQDPDAEHWELQGGIKKGTVSVWDQEQQAPIEAVEQCDIARTGSAMKTQDVKGANFKYAKILTSRFFGAGIVDLPVGGVKKPKNSRKMHMTFFVAQGRVTVEVGPLNTEATRFSIGKGGFWQVPRGNQYSIENEADKPARIFFSQACDLTPEE